MSATVHASVGNLLRLNVLVQFLLTIFQMHREIGGLIDAPNGTGSGVTFSTTLGSSAPRANSPAIMINPTAPTINFIPVIKPGHAQRVNIGRIGRMSS